MAKAMPKVMIDISCTPDTPEWYTVVTKYNYEKKFAKDVMLGKERGGVEEYIKEIVVPFRETKETKILKSGKTKEKIKIEKIMPLYVFVKCIMNDRVWDYLRSKAGFSAVLAIGDQLVETPEHEIMKVKEICGLLEKEKKEERKDKMDYLNEIISKYNEGQTVEIKKGMFKGYIGDITKIEKAKAKVHIKLDNGVDVELDIIDID